MVIRSRCPLKEQFGQGGQSGQVERLSGELYAACRLSLTLGCETDRCLQAVAESLIGNDYWMICVPTHLPCPKRR